MTVVKTNSRGSWGSSLGFILASAGAAVGLGNIQRFPYVVATHGGAAFVLIYLLCVIFLAIPLMLVEFSLGRHTERNPNCAIEAIKPGSYWRFGGLLTIVTAFAILSYYSVVGGWVFAYIGGMVVENPPELNQLSQDPWEVFPLMLLFLGIVAVVVNKGVKGGIERVSKVVMPLLLVLMIGLAIRSCTLPGAYDGLLYYLYPDFSKLTGSSFIFALSQAFFSLCIGEAVLVTYGSYAGRSENLFTSALSIAFFDTIVALIAGLIIFPSLSAHGLTSEGGIGLVFHVLPIVFSQMHFGYLFGFLFFLLLAFAALTTGIALLEIPVMYLIDRWNWKRGRAVITVLIAVFILGIPSAVSRGISPTFTFLELPALSLYGFYEIMDFFWGGIAMVVGGLSLCIFTAWVWGAEFAAKELADGSSEFVPFAPTWKFLIRYVAPVLIFAVLISLLF